MGKKSFMKGIFSLTSHFERFLKGEHNQVYFNLSSFKPRIFRQPYHFKLENFSAPFKKSQTVARAKFPVLFTDFLCRRKGLDLGTYSLETRK